MTKVLLLIVVLIAGATAFALNVGGIKDQCRLQIWTWSHAREAAAARSNSTVLSHWDAWGFGADDNDSYLVSDPANVLSGALEPVRRPTLSDRQAQVAEAWRKSHKLNCEVVWVKRLRSGFYLIATYDCLLHILAPAQ